MSFGTYGWIGKFMRLFGMPDGSVDDEVSRPQRARFRYNFPLDRLEVSKDGGPYIQIQDGPLPADIDDYGIAADTTALSAEDDTVLGDGAVFYVRSLRDEFVLDENSTLTADGITVLNTLSGTGRWIRRELGDQRWREQTSWFIDEAAGNDENDGASAGAALATYAEFERRIGRGRTIDRLYNIEFIGNLTDVEVTLSAAWDAGTFAAAGGIIFTASAPQSVTQHTLASVSAHDNATRSFGQITVTGHDFTPQQGRRIVPTDGAAAGAWGWVGSIAEDGSVDTASTGPFYDNGAQTEVFPAGGDTVEVQELSTIASMRLAPGANVAVIDADVLELGVRDGALASPFGSSARAIRCAGGTVITQGCFLNDNDGTDSLAVHRGGQLWALATTMIAGNLLLTQAWAECRRTLAFLGAVNGTAGGGGDTFQLQMSDARLFAASGTAVCWFDDAGVLGRGAISLAKASHFGVALGETWVRSWTSDAANVMAFIGSSCTLGTEPGNPLDANAGGDDYKVGSLAATDLALNPTQQDAATLAGLIEEHVA